MYRHHLHMEPSLFGTRNARDRCKYIYHDFILPSAIVDGNVDVSEDGFNQHLTPAFSNSSDISEWQCDAYAHARSQAMFTSLTTILYALSINFCQLLHNAIRIFYKPGDRQQRWWRGRLSTKLKMMRAVFFCRFARANEFLFLTITLY